jgi:hypothetical protein
MVDDDDDDDDEDADGDEGTTKVSNSDGVNFVSSPDKDDMSRLLSRAMHKLCKTVNEMGNEHELMVIVLLPVFEMTFPLTNWRFELISAGLMRPTSFSREDDENMSDPRMEIKYWMRIGDDDKEEEEEADDDDDDDEEEDGNGAGRMIRGDFSFGLISSRREKI